MSARFNTGVPGVYLRALRQEDRALRLVRTDVAGFLGFTERGPLPLPDDPLHGVTRLRSWDEFLKTYGGFIRHGTLAYAVRAFFENGGRVCHVVRVAPMEPATTAAERRQRPHEAFFAVPERKRPMIPNTTAERVKGEPTKIKLRSALNVAAGDLIGLENSDVQIFCNVIERESDTLALARPLPEIWETASVTVFDSALRIEARTKGGWANSLRLEIKAIAYSQTTPGPASEFSLRITLDRGEQQLGSVEEEFFSRLSLDPGSQNFAEDQVRRLSNLITIEVPRRFGRLPAGLLVSDGPLADSLPLWLEGGQDALSAVTLRDFTGGTDDLRGLRLFEEIDEISILCAPDAVYVAPPSDAEIEPVVDECVAKKAEPSLPVDEPPQMPPAKEIQWAMLDQCERLRDRVAILDPLASDTSADKLEKCRNQFSSPFGALYFPWLKVPDPLSSAGLTRPVPPCGHVAGTYARIDNESGVHRPPANVALEFVTDLAVEVDDEFQENLNPRSINALRSLAGRGIRVWSARSLASASDANWRFIHKRRLMCMIEESIEKSMPWAVFEPNDETLRITLRHTLTVFLERIWRLGGLEGERPEQGFYVKCDETNNPRQVTDTGRCICEIGVAIAAPMEFIVFELRQSPAGAELVEV